MAYNFGQNRIGAGGNQERNGGTPSESMDGCTGNI